MSALMMNEGRLDDTSSGPAPRSEDPARDAADAFGELLEEAGIDIGGGAAPAGRPPPPGPSPSTCPSRCPPSSSAR